MSGSGKVALWVHEEVDVYMLFDAWLRGEKPYKRS
jgi:hypothetical protein